MRSWVSWSWCASFALLASNCLILIFSLSACSVSSLARAAPTVLALSSFLVSDLSPSKRLLGSSSSLLGLDLGVSSTLAFLGVLVCSFEDVLFLFTLSLRKTVWPPAEPHLLVVSAAFRILSFVSLEFTVSLVTGDLSLLDDGSMGWAPIMCSCSSVIDKKDQCS